MIGMSNCWELVKHSITTIHYKDKSDDRELSNNEITGDNGHYEPELELYIISQLTQVTYISWYMCSKRTSTSFGHEQFLFSSSFIFWLYRNFVFFFFFFSFLLDDEEVCDTAVTWHITWCDVIGLEDGERI